MQNQEESKIAERRDAFASIAWWQSMAFIFMLAFVWVSELLDLPGRMFSVASEPEPFNLGRACLLSAIIIAGGIVTIGHTYEQQRALLRRLLETCLYCHRVKTPAGQWEHVEEYFIGHYPVAMSRKVCPKCEEMLKNVGDRKEPVPG